MHGEPLGTFIETGPDRATFTYEPSYSGTPLSLSLPLGSTPPEKAAYFYLENLLTENEDGRRRLAHALETPNDTFGLISKIGEDVAGAVVLSPDPHLPERSSEPPLEATEDQIAYWIATLKRDPSTPPPDGIKPRFSLAGQQAKFSLSRVGDSWFWSTAQMPSTHIFKPAFVQHEALHRAEDACLALASEIGVPASDSEIMRFRDQEVFAVRRWDRVGGARIHAEDLLQAYGEPWTDKYGMYADDARRFMANYGLEREYLRQVLFNVAIGNADAHAKNYSLLLAGDQVRLAPLYDAVPIFLYPQYSQNLCISFSGNRYRLSDGITEADWIEWAGTTGYDPDLVIDEMRMIFTEVSQRLPGVLELAGLKPAMVDSAHRYVTHVRGSLPKAQRDQGPPRASR